MKYQHDNTGMDAKIKFLDRAAETYALKAPSVSAHIMLERAATAEKLDTIESKKHRKDVCRACGTLLIPALTSSVSMSSGRNSRIVSSLSKRKGHSKSMQSEKTLETHCLACHRFSKVAIRPSKRQGLGEQDHFASDSKVQSSAGIGMENELPTTPKPMNVSSKRTKARKKGGLQALVQRTKESNQTNNSFGLDLMDFMKEG